MSVTTVQRDDPMAGYLASLLLGMMVSAWLASSLADLLPFDLSTFEKQSWRQCIGAGLFMAIAFCNPVGLLIRKGAVGPSILRFILGGVAGASLQAVVFAPIAGGQLSYLLVLFSAGLLIPASIALERVNLGLKMKGTSLGDEVGRQVLRVLSWPDRYLFTGLMASCFVFFWVYMPSWLTTLMVLGVFLVLAVLSASWGSWRESRRSATQAENYDAWLEMEGEMETVAPTTAEVARIEGLKHLRNFLPGAVMFGGMTRLAVEILTWLFPASSQNLANPADGLVSAAIIAVSGLGLVFFGMLAALGLAFGAIELFSHAFRWDDHMKQGARFRLMRAFYFRPLSRFNQD